MTDYGYPNIGRSGRLCKGYYVVCQFGYSYLACRLEDKPDDPLLKAPLKEFLVSATYGEQFLQNLQSWKNEQNIVDKIFSYLVQDDNLQSTYDSAHCIKWIAKELLKGNLLLIPLDNV